MAGKKSGGKRMDGVKAPVPRKGSHKVVKGTC